MESKEYSWTWVTASRMLSPGECELVYALLDAGTDADYATIYDGENTSGDILTILRSATKTSQNFSPKEPVYCRRGLYVAAGTGTTKVFVQWRNL